MLALKLGCHLPEKDLSPRSPVFHSTVLTTCTVISLSSSWKTANQLRKERQHSTAKKYGELTSPRKQWVSPFSPLLSKSEWEEGKNDKRLL